MVGVVQRIGPTAQLHLHFPDGTENRMEIERYLNTGNSKLIPAVNPLEVRENSFRQARTQHSAKTMIYQSNGKLKVS